MPREKTVPRSRWPIALAAGLVLVLAGAPGVLGTLAERAYRELLGELLSALPPGSVLSEHYERGWFHSHASMELAVSPRPETQGAVPLHLRIDSRIEQGPLHWLSSGLPPSLARIHSQVKLPDHPSAPPLLVTTELGASGKTLSRFQVPAGDTTGSQGDHRLRHGELTGSLRLDPFSRTLGLDLDLPELALSTPAGPVATVADLRLTSELRSAPAGIHPGAPETKGGSLIGPARAQPGDLTGRTSAPGTRAPRYPLPGPIDLRAQAEARGLTLGDRLYREPRLGITAERLDGEAVAELASSLATFSSGAVPRPMRGLLGAALLAQVLPRLAATQPRISIDPLQMDTPEGPLSARLDLSLEPGSNAAKGPGLNPIRPSDWIAAIQAEGEIDLPEPLARRWATGEGLGSKTGAQPSRLQSWLDDGWVSLREGRIVSAFRLADGLLTINGKTLPLLGLPSGRLR
jgi:uncharacterized protein YdgA (DUF945 family)